MLLTEIQISLEQNIQEGTRLTSREADYRLGREELRVDLGYATKPSALRFLRNSIQTYCRQEDTHPHCLHLHFQQRIWWSSAQLQRLQ